MSNWSINSSYPEHGVSLQNLVQYQERCAHPTLSLCLLYQMSADSKAVIKTIIKPVLGFPICAVLDPEFLKAGVIRPSIQSHSSGPLMHHMHSSRIMWLQPKKKRLQSFLLLRLRHPTEHRGHTVKPEINHGLVGSQHKSQYHDFRCLRTQRSRLSREDCSGDAWLDPFWPLVNSASAWACFVI